MHPARALNRVGSSPALLSSCATAPPTQAERDKEEGNDGSEVAARVEQRDHCVVVVVVILLRSPLFYEAG